MNPVSTESYKGVRDFYPDFYDQWKQILDKVAATVEKFGYRRYDASILEPAELYRSKTSEEIVNEQTYTFKDRGDREVTLRPEMTPTVARMIAAKYKEMSFPVRWYSLPNLFRYEKPQRGRMREHIQLNVDLFGATGEHADLEMLSIAHSVLTGFGVDQKEFAIRINSRQLIQALYAHMGLTDEQRKAISRLIDKKNKIPQEVFMGELDTIGLTPEANRALTTFLAAKDIKDVGEKLAGQPAIAEHATALHHTLSQLERLGITNAVFDPTLMRGFDYYTGIIFEVFDNHPDNNRSLFGGGRYDELTALFGTPPIAAIGFGMGDVTLQDFLETRGLFPAVRSPIDVYVCTAEGATYTQAFALGNVMRSQGLRAVVDGSGKKVGDQISRAAKEMARFVTVIGGNELSTGTLTLKRLEDGQTKSAELEMLARTIATF